MDESGISALVVEDDSDMALQLKRILVNRFPAEAQIAGDLEEARRMMAAEQFDIITLDYMLPDGEGLTLLEQITSQDDYTRVIMVTGHGDEETAVRSFHMRASGYVVKDARMATMLKDAFNKAIASIELETALKALDESREELTLIADNVPLLIAHIGADRRYIYVNKKYSTWMLGTAESFVGKHVSDVIGEQAYAVIGPQIDRVLKGERVTFVHSFPGVGREGTLKILLVPHVNEKSEVQDYFFFGEDVEHPQDA